MLNYLLSQYEKTKWPFFLVTNLMFIGVWDKDVANKLVREGKAKKRMGMHGDILEILIDKI